MIQLFNENYYQIESNFYPRITTILSVYPKGYGFDQWLKTNGVGADDLRDEAAEIGTNTHKSIERLLNGEELFFENYKQREWQCLMSFVEWHKKFQPKTLEKEKVVYSHKSKVAGTLDYLCEIDGKRYLIDFKTAKQVRTSHKIQVMAYKYCLEEMEQKKVDHVAILRVGTRHKNGGYEFHIVEDDEDKLINLFWATKQQFDYEFAKDDIKPVEVPETLKLCLTNTSTAGNSLPKKASNPVKRKKKTKNVPNVVAETGVSITA